MAKNMREVRDKFKSDLVYLLDLALSLNAAVSFGIEDMREKLRADPEVGYGMMVVDEISGSKLVATRRSHRVKLADVLKVVINNQNAIFELAHSQIIQLWQDFLDRVFTEIFTDHFSGKATYPRASKIDVEINFSSDTMSNLTGNLQERALQNYQFLNADQKLAFVEKALGAKIPDQIKASVKKQIAIRNAFQHHGGIVRADDLRRLGVKTIKTIDETGQTSNCGVGDKIAMSFWELSSAVRDFKTAADFLVRK